MERIHDTEPGEHREAVRPAHDPGADVREAVAKAAAAVQTPAENPLPRVLVFDGDISAGTASIRLRRVEATVQIVSGDGKTIPTLDGKPHPQMGTPIGVADDGTSILYESHVDAMLHALARQPEAPETARDGFLHRIFGMDILDELPSLVDLAETARAVQASDRILSFEQMPEGSPTSITLTRPKMPWES